MERIYATLRSKEHRPASRSRYASRWWSHEYKVIGLGRIRKLLAVSPEPSLRLWEMEVWQGSLLVNADNKVCSFVDAIEMAHKRVANYRRLREQGVTLRYWWDLVDEARI